LLRSSIWSKKSDSPILEKQTKAIKNWTLYLYASIVLLGWMIILVFITNGCKYTSNGNGYQITFAALFWLFFFIKLLATPELLYGYDFMKVKIEAYKKAEVVLDAIWILKTRPAITNQKDLKITKSVTSNLNSYIRQIESLSFHTSTFRNPEITVDEFAQKLNIPKVHLLYVFKYHCAINFVDYKKMVRIHDATKLLETGFLKSNTMETLAKEVGFSSYKPFFNSFKSIIGMSPQEYYKNY
jgi:AraC-like DNA-binding protein